MVFIGYGMARDGYANTWRYRDWVINAMNEDLPYDQFVKAQIGGLAARQGASEEAASWTGFFWTRSLVHRR